MEQAINLSKKLYTHSFVRYVIIGGSTFAMDFGLLVLLHGLLDVNLLLATTISYWTSIVFNFYANRHWSFGAKGSPIARHLVAYGTLLAVNYLFTIGFIAVATHYGMHYTIAKVLSVGIQTSWTYFAYKRIVFR
jgi:putative flippase GtrA